jgi:hypothetical protein
MKCRGGFSPPDRLDNGLGRGKTAPTLLLYLILKGREKPSHTVVASNSQHLILNERGIPAPTLLSHLILKDHWSIPLWLTAGGPTLLQPGTTWLKTLLSDELSANTLHLSDTHLWP